MDAQGGTTADGADAGSTTSADGTYRLTINGGSSSLKLALFARGNPPRKIASGKVERIGLGDARPVASDGSGGVKSTRPVEASGLEQAAGPVVEWMRGQVGLGTVAAVGHRVVHGGELYRPERVTPGLLDALRAVGPLDPEHVPGEVALIEAFGARLPGVPQVACFDTAFHHGLPRVARIVPIPRR